jgi:methyltransferase family protein
VIDRFDEWIAGLEARHLADLRFSEVSGALRAVSSAYVERRVKLATGAALSGAGKRAAFALFYGPLHYLLVRHIVLAIPAAAAAARTLIDFGCGTGAAGAAWAAACPRPPRIIGIDKNPWALAEAARTYREFGLVSRVIRDDFATTPLPKGPAHLIAAFAVNELGDDRRAALLPRLVERAKRGDRVLVVEPLARFVAPWWEHWRDAFVTAGGRADEWRFRADLPPIVGKLDRAAGLDHREITGRSIWC